MLLSSSRSSALHFSLGAALTLTLTLAATHSPLRAPQPVASATSVADERRALLANELATKVKSLLDFSYGPGSSQVEVRVDLDEGETEFHSTQHKGPGSVTHETRLEESYDKGGGQPGPLSRGAASEATQVVTGDDTPEDTATMPTGATRGQYQNVKSNTTRDYDKNEITSVCHVPRIMAIHCAVALKVPHQEEQARQLVSGLLGLQQRPGDSLSLACVPQKSLFQGL